MVEVIHKGAYLRGGQLVWAQQPDAQARRGTIA